MNWETPQYDRQTVNAAARQLLAAEAGQLWTAQDDEALKIVNNWRNSHFFPLNTFKVTLRHKAKHVFATAIVSERRKRLSSILAKLRNQPLMKLTQMQDIAGCRAVMGSARTVYELVEVYKQSDLKHKLLPIDDYIIKPRSSGYRGVHLIYSYFSDKNETHNGLKVELQFRSPLQHAWATAVETVGTFLGQALKSSLGEDSWLRFFALMGSYIANREKTAPVPGTPTDLNELRSEIRDQETRLGVISHLKAYRTGLEVTREHKGAKYYLLTLDIAKSMLNVRSYSGSELEQALHQAGAVEGKEGFDVVLVSVSSLKTLRRAYPNYFADTDAFLTIVQEAAGIGIHSLPRRKVEA
jgi:Region found in RelA / SpoT proteins